MSEQTHEHSESCDNDLVMFVKVDGTVKTAGRYGRDSLKMLDILNYVQGRLIDFITENSRTSHESADGHTIVVDGQLFSKVGD